MIFKQELTPKGIRDLINSQLDDLITIRQKNKNAMLRQQGTIAKRLWVFFIFSNARSIKKSISDVEETFASRMQEITRIEKELIALKEQTYDIKKEQEIYLSFRENQLLKQPIDELVYGRFLG